MKNLANIIEKLKQNEVVAYPTEAVFGLGCNPNSEQAVRKLLTLKQRPVEKGLILLASDLHYLLPFIDETQLGQAELARLNQVSEQAITWVVPAKVGTPKFLTGKFDSIAIRLCKSTALQALCEGTGFALTSTSANLSGQTPCRSATEVLAQFGQDFPVLEAATEGRQNPSEIRDIFTQHIFRQG